MNIAEMLHAQAEARPDAAAIIDGRGGRDRRLSFAELQRSAHRTAALLRARGLEAGDRVLVWHPMSAELYVVLAAVFGLGLVAMFVDPAADRKHIERCCRQLPPRGFIGGATAHAARLLVPSLRRVAVRISIGTRVPGATPLESAGGLPEADALAPCGPDAPALLTFTSGSTGRPKAALRSHGFLRAQHHAIRQCLELTAGETELATLPIFLLANLAAGVSSIIPDANLRRPGDVDPAPIVAQIARLAPTRSAAAPAFYDRLLDCCERTGVTLPSLRRIFTGGALVSPAVMDRLHAVAPHARISAVYGSTEAEPIASVSRDEMGPEDLERMCRGHGVLAGRPVPGLDARVVRDQWGRPLGPLTAEQLARLTLRPGEVGEIIVRGAHVLSGYVDPCGDEDNKLAVGGARWHRTGDAGFFDGRGRLWLAGRCAARIDDARGTLYPFGVEAAALRDPNVRRAAMVAHRGRRVLALELRTRTRQAELDDLRRSLDFTHIDCLRIFRRLPVDRRHGSKIDYPALRALMRTTA